MEDLKQFITCTPEEYTKCFLEFAKDAKPLIKTQDDALWLDKVILHIEEVLKHNHMEMSHTFSSYITSVSEQIIASMLRRSNDKLRTAEQQGFYNMVGADIIPINPQNSDELSAAEIKTVSFSASLKDTNNGSPYEASVCNVESKFTSIIILLLDPNFRNKPYRLRCVSVDEYSTLSLTCRFGEVVEIRNKKYHNASSTNFPGTEIEIEDLCIPNDKLYEFNMPKMNKVIKEQKVPKNQIHYWTEIFKMLIDKDAKNQLPKYFTRTPNTNSWNKNNKKVIATRKGFKIIKT